MKNITWIDSLKGIAMCGIILIHSGVGALPSVIVSRIGDSGKYGVQLFLLLSAYLIYDSLDRYFACREINFSNSLKWVIKKIIILIPLYYLSLLINIFAGGQSYWLGTQGKITIWNIVFLHNCRL